MPRIESSHALLTVLEDDVEWEWADWEWIPGDPIPELEFTASPYIQGWIDIVRGGKDAWKGAIERDGLFIAIDTSMGGVRIMFCRHKR